MGMGEVPVAVVVKVRERVDPMGDRDRYLVKPLAEMQMFIDIW